MENTKEITLDYLKLIYHHLLIGFPLEQLQELKTKDNVDHVGVSQPLED